MFDGDNRVMRLLVLLGIDWIVVADIVDSPMMLDNFATPSYC